MNLTPLFIDATIPLTLTERVLSLAGRLKLCCVKYKCMNTVDIVWYDVFERESSCLTVFDIYVLIRERLRF